MDLIPGLIVAAGGVVLDRGRVLLVHRTQHRDWTLPKGKTKAGETPMQTALREVLEETGYEAEVTGFLGAIGYLVENTPKVVIFWRMKPRRERRSAIDPCEIARTEWVETGDAAARLSYPLEREIVSRATGRQAK